MNLPEEERLPIIGPGITGVSVFARKGSYSHSFAAAARKHGWPLGNTVPPVWDFRFYRCDGSSMLLHPPWKRKGRRGMQATPYRDGDPSSEAVPKRGPGWSDGKGTFRAYHQAPYLAAP